MKARALIVTGSQSDQHDDSDQDGEEGTLHDPLVRRGGTIRVIAVVAVIVASLAESRITAAAATATATAAGTVGASCTRLITGATAVFRNAVVGGRARRRGRRGAGAEIGVEAGSTKRGEHRVVVTELERTLKAVLVSKDVRFLAISRV